MNFSLSFLMLCLTACAWAYPYPLLTSDELAEVQLLPQDIEWAPSESAEEQELLRVRRQLNVQGGGSPRQGFDLSVNGRAPVWQSQNGRHSLDATGQYSQHLGGPYGNSRPNFGAGAMYTFRF